MRAVDQSCDSAAKVSSLICCSPCTFGSLERGSSVTSKESNHAAIQLQLSLHLQVWLAPQQLLRTLPMAQGL
jgi:hypothetical protein